ncbi:MAG TPA: tRNA pseudouridine(55) synthase TruB [Candidatus Binatia bacterium]|nr:tRNA pseudouridine(55) synthase TruB [Candidatus Binatia bacterium]
MSRLNGILLVDKPEGCSSAEVVRVVKKRLAVEKIGHIGTLDPFATGLLPLCLGTGTKVAQFLVAGRKTYTGTIRLGVETDTFDATGTVTRTAPVPPCGPEVLQDLRRRFSGEYWQTPPMYSAVKRQGIPLYKLARRGGMVEREARKVSIEEFTLGQTATDTLDFSLSCSKGTYIRSLAADLGAALGCGAHLVTLRRTACGSFTVGEAVPFARLSTWGAGDVLPLLSPAQALRDYRAVPVSAETAERLRRGQQDSLRTLPCAESIGETVRLLSAGELVAVAEWQHGQWRLARVL